MVIYDDLSDRAMLEQHLAVNLFGPWNLTQALLPLLTRSRGAIVNVPSLAGAAALQDHSVVFGFEGGVLVAVSVVAGTPGSARYQRPCRACRSDEHPHVTRPPGPEGIH